MIAPQIASKIRVIDFVASSLDGITKSTSDHRILNYAGQDVTEERPDSPKSLTFYLIMALVLGIFIPVIIISLRDYLNEKILSKSDLTKITNIPIIGVIGNSDKSNDLVVLDNPKSVISESFRSLRTNIQYLSSEIENKVVTITSSVGSEGKTFCTSNLALIMAAAGYKTILIGADLRKPKTHEVFNVDNSLGLSSYLINKSTLSEIVHKTDAEKLRVIPSGPIPPNPSELLNSDRMKKLIALFTIAVSTATMAATPIDRGVVTDTYKKVIKQIPYRVEVCQDRVQPAGDGSATNELVGALFGGAIGNQFGNGDGKDAMTLFGALMGASLAHDEEVKNGQGSRVVTVCDVQTRYEEEVSEVYSHSTVVFYVDGKHYSLNFKK